MAIQQRLGANRITMLSCLSCPQTVHCQLLGPHFCVAVKALPDSSRYCLCTSTQWVGKQRWSRTQAVAGSTAKAPLAEQFPTATAPLCELMQVSYNFSCLLPRPSAHCLLSGLLPVHKCPFLTSHSVCHALYRAVHHGLMAPKCP